MLTTIASQTQEGTQTQEYDATDRFGRRIGARASLETVVWVEDEKGWSSVPAGTYYVFKPHALRDGKSYGASQPAQQFATQAERQAAVNKYFLGAQKRALKASVSQGA
jgi:hypothetical protein